MRTSHALPLMGGILCMAATACAPVPLTREPPAGGLRTGVTVLVDDGTCPAGQIKQVTGAPNQQVGTGGVGSGRIYRCVPR